MMTRDGHLVHYGEILMFTFVFAFGCLSGAHAFSQTPEHSPMSQEEFEARKRGQDKFHSLLNAGDAFFKQNDNVKAEYYYLEAYTFSRGSSSESVARYSLAKFYSDIGECEKALRLVDMALSRLQRDEPAWTMYVGMKQHLLQKIEAQRQGEKIKEPKSAPSTSAQSQPIRRIADFHTANYASQKQFLEKELPEDTEIHSLSKQAMLAEHAGKFSEAKTFYEKMLPQKEQVVAAFREEGWVMLHPAVQRMSELTGDEAREKEMLIWIRDNMLNPQGQYHRTLSGLMPHVIDHLNKQIKKYQL